jgi:rhodanese-related sulfurtransferase
MKVAVKTREERICEICYLPPQTSLIDPKNPLAARAARQLERYLADPDAGFDLPLLIEGTPFQRRLWDALCEIPRGRTLTYGALAQRLDELPRDRTLATICKGGKRSGLAASVLQREGFETIHVARGGVGTWQAEGRPVESGAVAAPSGRGST